MRTIIVIKAIPFTFLDDDYVIGVEKGAIDLINKKIPFNIALGDFDSINDEEYELIKKYNYLKLPIEKDVTDLAYALSISKGDVVVLGGINGPRVEHFYSNLLLLKMHPNVRFIDEKSIIYTLGEGIHYFNKDEYRFISFFALEEAIISLVGFKYELDHYLLNVNDNLGISNEIIAGTLRIDKGRVLVIKTKDDA